MERLKGGAALLLGGLAAYLQKYWLVYVLVAVAVLMDLISGMAAAVVAGEGLSSGVARKGMLKKLMLLFAVGWGTFLDVLLPFAAAAVDLRLPTGLLFSVVVCVYICVGESISVMENLCRATGREPPALIRKLLLQAKEQLNKEKTDE